MRPFLAIAIVIVMLGVVQAYIIFQSTLPIPESVSLLDREAEGKFTIDITLTFDAKTDAFALDKKTSMLVSFANRELLRTQEPIEAGTPLKIEPVEGIVEGKNEFYVEILTGDVSASADSFSLNAGTNSKALARAVRIRVFRDEREIADATKWSPPGEPVKGKVTIDVPQTLRDQRADDHSH